ncbi:unnamed protein product, partial [Didymodactylos carnosus]
MPVVDSVNDRQDFINLLFQIVRTPGDNSSLDSNGENAIRKDDTLSRKNSVDAVGVKQEPSSSSPPPPPPPSSPSPPPPPPPEEIIILDDADRTKSSNNEINEKEVESGEITESDETENEDNLEELSLRLRALRTLPDVTEHVKKKKNSKLKKKRLGQQHQYQQSSRSFKNQSSRFDNDDIDLRSYIKKRTTSSSASRLSQSTQQHSPTINEFPQDKDYRPNRNHIVDLLISLMSSSTTDTMQKQQQSPASIHQNSTQFAQHGLLPIPLNNINNLQQQSTLTDCYDVLQMDIEDQTQSPSNIISPPLTCYDQLPPLPPLPSSIQNSYNYFNQFIPLHPTFLRPPQQSWPLPNFITQNANPFPTAPFWRTTPPPEIPVPTATDIDLRQQPSSLLTTVLQPPPPPPQAEQQSVTSSNKRIILMNSDNVLKKVRRKRLRKISKKRRLEMKQQQQTQVPIMVQDQSEDLQPDSTTTVLTSTTDGAQSTKIPLSTENNDEDLEELSLRRQLLENLSSKRRKKLEVVPRSATAVSAPISPPVLQTQQAKVAPLVKPLDSPTKYSVNQRYKRVKATVPMTNGSHVALSTTSSFNNTLTTNTTTRIIPQTNVTPAQIAVTTQTLYQSRSKIIRKAETEADLPQSRPVIVTFDQSSDDDEQTTKAISLRTDTLTVPNSVQHDEVESIQRLHQLHEEVTRRSNVAVHLAQPTPSINKESSLFSTYEIADLLEKRRCLLSEHSKLEEVKKRTKKKKLDNIMLTREIEQLGEKLLKLKSQHTANTLDITQLQKEALLITETIKSQEDLIRQSTIFNSIVSTITNNQPSNIETVHVPRVIATNLLKKQQPVVDIDYKKISTQLDTYSTTVDNTLLRTRSFAHPNSNDYWKNCLQSYFIDLNRPFCPYELQGLCKAQNCSFQHQHQVDERMNTFLSKTDPQLQFFHVTHEEKEHILKEIKPVCSLNPFEFDETLLENNITDKKIQRCRSKLERYLSVCTEEFRYFRENTKSESVSAIHPLLKLVANELDSIDFSPEHTVAMLCEGLESNRTSSELWCFYLEFSSLKMSDIEIQLLCSASLKNSQSYELFWT